MELASQALYSLGKKKKFSILLKGGHLPKQSRSKTVADYKELLDE